MLPDEQLLDCAVLAAKTAGEHALRNAGRREEALDEPRHDVKLALDVECQRAAEKIIRGAFPDHDMLGEEDPDAEDTPPAGYQWIIDPIDGTVNFSHALPWWCCSIAVRHGGTVRAGAVYGPETGELYTATAAGPALRNGTPVSVSDTTRLDRAVVYTGFDKSEAADGAPLALLRSIARHVQRPRVVGSAALDLCHVAAGMGDGYFEAGIFIWDVAAAGLVLERAGGRTELLARTGRRLSYLGTNGRIHAELKAAVLEGMSGGSGQ